MAWEIIQKFLSTAYNAILKWIDYRNRRIERDMELGHDIAVRDQLVTELENGSTSLDYLKEKLGGMKENELRTHLRAIKAESQTVFGTEHWIFSDQKRKIVEERSQEISEWLKVYLQDHVFRQFGPMLKKINEKFEGVSRRELMDGLKGIGAREHSSSREAWALPKENREDGTESGQSEPEKGREKLEEESGWKKKSLVIIACVVVIFAIILLLAYIFGDSNACNDSLPDGC